MAARCLFQSLATGRKSVLTTVSRSYMAACSASCLPNSSFLLRLRPLVAASGGSYFRPLAPALSTRGFATRHTSSSLNDPNPNWSNRPPKETILLDGCDFEHWLVVVEKPEGDPTRDEIIDSYIKTLATVVGSEEEARMKIYSVSTRHYFAFGALVSEELSYKLKEIPGVRWVLPDSYLNVREKDYGGEPFINGQAVPYDPKYHEEWVRNNARANERNRRNDRPRNFDRSRNFERRRENYGPQPTTGVPPPGGPNSAPMGGGQSNSGPNMTPASGPPLASPQLNRPNAYPPPSNPSNPGQSNMGWQPRYGQNVAPPPNAPNHGPGQPNFGGQANYGHNVSSSPNAPNHGPGQPNFRGQQSYGDVPPNNVSPPPNAPNHGPGQPNFGGQQSYGDVPPNNVSPPPNAPNHGPGQPNFGGQQSYGDVPPSNVSPPPNAPNHGPGQPNFGGQQRYGGAPPSNPGYIRGPPNNGPYHSSPNAGGAPYQQGPGQNQNEFAPRFGPNQGQYQNPNQGPNPQHGYAPNEQAAHNASKMWDAQGPNPQHGYAPNDVGVNQPQSQNVPGRDMPPRY